MTNKVGKRHPDEQHHVTPDEQHHVTPGEQHHVIPNEQHHVIPNVCEGSFMGYVLN